MIALWIVIGIAVILIGAGLYDRAIRAQGRRVRSSGEMLGAEREIRGSVRGARFGAAPKMDTWKRSDSKD